MNTAVTVEYLKLTLRLLSAIAILLCKIAIWFAILIITTVTVIFIPCHVDTQGPLLEPCAHMGLETILETFRLEPETSNSQRFSAYGTYALPPNPRPLEVSTVLLRCGAVVFGACSLYCPPACLPACRAARRGQ